MKKALLLFFLLVPLFVNAQDWFRANAIRFATDGEYSEWQKCNISVSIGDDMKVKIYAKENHTIRKVKNGDEMVDEFGVSHLFWMGVDENGSDCIICIKSDAKNYIHLMITFIKDNFVVCYNLIPDD